MKPPKSSLPSTCMVAATGGTEIIDSSSEKADRTPRRSVDMLCAAQLRDRYLAVDDKRRVLTGRDGGKQRRRHVVQISN